MLKPIYLHKEMYVEYFMGHIERYNYTGRDREVGFVLTFRNTPEKLA